MHTLQKYRIVMDIVGGVVGIVKVLRRCVASSLDILLAPVSIFKCCQFLKASVYRFDILTVTILHFFLSQEMFGGKSSSLVQLSFSVAKSGSISFFTYRLKLTILDL